MLSVSTLLSVFVIFLDSTFITLCFLLFDRVAARLAVIFSVYILDQNIYIMDNICIYNLYT